MNNGKNGDMPVFPLRESMSIVQVRMLRNAIWGETRQQQENFLKIIFIL